MITKLRAHSFGTRDIVFSVVFIGTRSGKIKNSEYYSLK